MLHKCQRANKRAINAKFLGRMNTEGDHYKEEQFLSACTPASNDVGGKLTLLCETVRKGTVLCPDSSNVPLTGR